jgi:putative heme iron utilization protein
MTTRPDPVQAADEAGRAQARALLAEARHAALAYADPATGHPSIARIALGLDDRGEPLTFISALSAHHAGLMADPRASVLVGEPGKRGDPLTHPRLMLQAMARFVERSDPDHAILRELWLRDHPKAKLYIDFPDFRFVRLEPGGALLNGGFGRALRLDREDLRPA